MSSIHDDNDITQAKRIEAGLLAQDCLDKGDHPVGATAEELLALVEEGRQAQENLVLANLGLVGIIAAEAKRFSHGQFSDFFQEGCLALQQAVMKYDWRKGRFGPYAGMWIRSAVRRASASQPGYVGSWEWEDANAISSVERSVAHLGMAQVLQLVPARTREILQLRAGWDGEPRSRQVVADRMGLTVAKVRRLERAGMAQVRREWELAEAA